MRCAWIRFERDARQTCGQHPTHRERRRRRRIAGRGIGQARKRADRRQNFGRPRDLGVVDDDDAARDRARRDTFDAR